ncbi:dentin sialophosphoprotein isoform X7 [Nilaparvata lugens]|uniref:dentin sialophosphoprotein isoform X6 n=1 Tax=Nilaparvata lugens TaxID=108931 RepID=UPI00193CEC17|nr:dentin sialophosphoprotein isoform X6 [Nilaparvata lugens]XP_039295691.1 dentin sialophosphoprotein isoform X7 [Nilaparvata lugens]
MKRQRGSGSEDGGGKSSYKRSKKEKRQSETEEEWSRVASKKSVMENIVKIGGKDKRRESGGKPVESPDSDDDFREDLRKKRESFLKTVVAKRCEKRHSMSDSEDGGVEELPTNQRSDKSPIKKTPVNEKSNSSDSELDTYKLVKSSTTNQRSGKSPIKKTPVNEKSNSSDSDSDTDKLVKSSTTNQRSGKSPIKKTPVNEKSNSSDSEFDTYKLVKYSTTNQRSGKSPIKKTPVNEKSNSSDSDSDDKRVNKSSTSIQRSGKSPIKKTPVNEKSNSSDSDSEDNKLNNSSTSNKFKSLKTVTSSLKKSSNDEMMSQDMFEADSDDEVENNSDPSESVKYNGDKSRKGDSDSDDRQGKTNSKSNSDKRRNSSKSNSDSDSSSKIQEKSKDSNKSMQDELWKRIEKKLSEGIKEEYFEEDVFYLEDLSDNDEIWVAPCPKSLDVSSLLGRKLNLTGRTDLKALQAKDGVSNMDCEAWASPIDQADNVVYCLQASKNRKKMIINPLKLAGRVSIEEKIQMPSPHEVEFSTTMKLVMPENLKVRHPLLGAEFKNQPKTFNSEDLSSPRVKKKKKKSKSLEHESEIMRNPPPSINYTSTIEENCDESMERKKKKKKKKSRDNECDEGQEDMSSYSHKSGDTSNLSEGEKKKKKKDKKRSREEADEEPSLQEDVPCEESSQHSSKKKKKKRRLDE